MKEVINLIENEDVDTFLVGEKGGYEIDAYDVVLDVQKEYPQIRIYLVISQMTDLHEMAAFIGKIGLYAVVLMTLFCRQSVNLATKGCVSYIGTAIS